MNQSSDFQLDRFLKFVRTKQFFLNALKDIDPMGFVFISSIEIQNDFLVNPSHDIKILIERGELEKTMCKTPKGHLAYQYRTLLPGYYDISLLKPRGSELDQLTAEMMKTLGMVSLLKDAPSTDFFDCFLKNKNRLIKQFLIVDKFSGRVHTPITSLKSDYRKNILIDCEETASLDVVTMQPLLLGKILYENIGSNDFSVWLNSGHDIYQIIQEKTKTKTRQEAKKKFFQILFSPKDENLSILFGNAKWIDWINDFKSIPIKENPHSLEKNHSNLAWLLQTTEVAIMRKVWQQLLDEGIKFLSVHDEIIVQQSGLIKAREIIESIFRANFEYFRLSETKSTIQSQTNEKRNSSHAVFTVKETKIINNQSLDNWNTHNWDEEIIELEKHFANITFPNHPIKLNQFHTVSNFETFIDVSLETVKANINNPTFLPYLDRLKSLHKIMLR